MSDTKHTPGPWGWTYDGSSDYSIGQADDPQVKRVANIYAWQRNHDQAMADCALIAAAPDLLAALKALLTECGGSDDVRIAAEAAIALAEGRIENHFHDAPDEP